VPAAVPGSVTPVAPVLVAARAIGAGSDLSCAAADRPTGGGLDNALQCWGTGLGALLGADPQTTPAIPMKDQNTSVVRFDVDSISVGRAHVCVKRNGVAESVQCLGLDNAWGQLGGAAVVPPEALEVPGTANAAAFAVGADHGCAVSAGGGVHCWGRNSSGQLGDGTLVTPGLAGDVRTIGTPVSVSGR
jgi:alpha-tubulin suppressor-like RCC1 family protein